MADKFDLVIIGGGPAGYEAAIEAAGKGMRTALVESRELGGTCLNRGCIPTKTILHSAQLYARMQTAEALGIHADGIACDMAKIQSRKDEVLGQLRGGIAMLMKKNKVTVYLGRGTIQNPHQILVTAPRKADYQTAEEQEIKAADSLEQTVLQTDYILIATGSVPAVPPIPGSGLHDVQSSDGFLESDRLYPRLTIVGGGVIGMEFASIYSALGCSVTVIEFLDRILANMDKEISQNLKMILKKRGVDIHTSAKVEQITEQEDGSLVCHYTEKDEAKSVVSDGILIATGRRANTEGLLAGGMELAMDRGRIVVDEYGRTSEANIYAAGDVTPGIQLAHAATAQGLNAVAHMVYLKEADISRPFDAPFRADLIPGCVYTNPEIGCIGLTQDEAKTAGIRVITKKYPMSANGKSLLSGQERGFIKVVAQEDTHRILGAQMMCARATDMISEFGTAIVNGLTLEQMAAVVRPHPTFCEGISEAVRA